MFHNINRQGLGLSMLILMSMMVAATIFPSPVQGFDFEKQTTTNELHTKPSKSHRVSHKTVLKVKTPQLQLPASKEDKFLSDSLLFLHN